MNYLVNEVINESRKTSFWLLHVHGVKEYCAVRIWLGEVLQGLRGECSKT